MDERIVSLVPGKWHHRDGVRRMAKALQARTVLSITAAECFIPGLVQELDAMDDQLSAIVAWLRTIGKPQIADAIEAGEWKGL